MPVWTDISFRNLIYRPAGKTGAGLDFAGDFVANFLTVADFELLGIHQQGQGIAVGNLDDFALMDCLSQYRNAGQQQERGQIAHMPSMAMKTPAQHCTRRGVAEVLPASR